MKSLKHILGSNGNTRSKLALCLPLLALHFVSAAQTNPNNNKEIPKIATEANNASIKDEKEPENKAPMILEGDALTALNVSSRPNGQYVGVYMVVDKDYPKSPEELIAVLKQYFDHYGLPVKFVKQDNPREGKYFHMAFYVGGESYRGDLSNGNVSLPEVVDNHKKVFMALRQMYIQKNNLDLANDGLSND